MTFTCGYCSFIISHNLILMCVLIDGNDNVFLLSQYIGDFHPDAQVNGLSGCKIIALICNKNFAISLASS